MITKFDIGEEVLVKAKIEEIQITKNGIINYVLYNEAWTCRAAFKENDLKKQLKEQK